MLRGDFSVFMNMVAMRHRGGAPACSGFSAKGVCVAAGIIMVGLVSSVLFCWLGAGVLCCSVGRG